MQLLSFYKLLFIFFFLVHSPMVFANQNTAIPQNAKNTAMSGAIYLNLSNIPKQSTGLIVSIYRTKDNFLKQAEEVYFFPMHKLIDNKLTLNNIVFGDFVIAVTADQNANQMLDTKIFGIPNEPVGFAGNPKSRFGPPRFKDCLITYEISEQEFSVSLVDI